MDSRSGLVAALASLMLAAGIDSAGAVEGLTDVDLQRIETSSITQLYLELDAVRSRDPDSPLVGAITGRIVQLGAPDPAQDDEDAPY